MVKHELHGPPCAVGEVEIRKTAFPELFKDIAISFMSLLILRPSFFWGGRVKINLYHTKAKFFIFCWRLESA